VPWVLLDMADSALVCGFRFVGTREFARKLLFARHTLGVELEKPLPVTSLSLKNTEMRTQFLRIASVQADCTLAELEDICKMMTSV
jgi:hypothetical protein